MSRSLLVTFATALLAIAMGYADQPKIVKVVIPAGKIAPNNGKAMYGSYCASCHGVDGRGHGPMASTLSTPPTDLTLLCRNHNGRYPDTHVVAVLQFGTGNPAHAMATMPTWGPILGKMNQVNPQERQLRITNLSRYLDTIQVR